MKLVRAQAPALMLFDIDGTLVRRAGPHHREALVEAVRRTTGWETTTEGIPVQGMLDGDILTAMMIRAGAGPGTVRRALPEVMKSAQMIYARSCPDLMHGRCPGVRSALFRLRRRGALIGLVTGNLQQIAWKKLERAGLHRFFRFGAFAEMAATRAELAAIAMRKARRERWIHRQAPVVLIGDHPNDIHAAKMNNIRSVAVATGIATRDELAACSPDILIEDLTLLQPELLW